MVLGVSAGPELESGAGLVLLFFDKAVPPIPPPIPPMMNRIPRTVAIVNIFLGPSPQNRRFFRLEGGSASCRTGS